MATRVYTGRVGFYSGPDALPVTRLVVNDKLGIRFAPSKALLSRALGERKKGNLENFWSTYREMYFQEMRSAYRSAYLAFEELLAREEVTLLCFCPRRAFCHRSLLADEILPALGAIPCGERPDPQSRLF